MVKHCVWDNKKMAKRVLRTIADGFRMCSLCRKHAPEKHLREKNTFSMSTSRSGLRVKCHDIVRVRHNEKTTLHNDP